MEFLCIQFIKKLQEHGFNKYKNDLLEMRNFYNNKNIRNDKWEKYPKNTEHFGYKSIDKTKSRFRNT